MTVTPAGTLQGNTLVGRLRAPDVLRGAIMVLMAIDHVRVYSGMPAGGASAGVFFTRWITHFCAPGFVFLAGAGAFLYMKKTGDKGLVSRYLLTRGLLLVLLELTLIRFCWTFNVNYGDFVLAGVIWMLGCCMVLMAALVRLSTRTIGIIGLFIVFAQQLFGLWPKLLPSSAQQSLGYVWEFIYSAGLQGPPGITILYVIVPWIGVMATGYAFGTILTREAQQRRRWCRIIGLSAIAVFIAAATIIILANPSDDGPAFIFRLLDQRKYPASQLYLLMTLGPLIALVPLAERARGWLSSALATIGSVPMFYYLLHIPLIHLLALIVMKAREGAIHHEWYDRAPFVWIENESQRWGLPLLYLVFAVAVVILYFLCRWYAAYKFKHPEKKWLKYL
jgi:uncharacterized membrane protein